MWVLLEFPEGRKDGWRREHIRFLVCPGVLRERVSLRYPEFYLTVPLKVIKISSFPIGGRWILWQNTLLIKSYGLVIEGLKILYWVRTWLQKNMMQTNGQSFFTTGVSIRSEGNVTGVLSRVPWSFKNTDQGVRHKLRLGSYISPVLRL